MKIELKSKQAVEFNELKVGETFLFAGSLYLRTDDTLQGWNAVELSCGRLCKFVGVGCLYTPHPTKVVSC